MLKPINWDEVEWFGIPPKDAQWLRGIIASGPQRIMTAPDFATSPKRRPHYKSDFVFVRGDGWALGTDKGHVFWAHRTWAKEWKWVIVMKEFSGPQVITIEEWREKFAKGEL